MTELVTSGIIQILRPDGSVAGAGFLISGDFAVTCTHVIAPEGCPIPKEVSVRFYGAAAPNRAVIDPLYCRPAQAEDIAFLTFAPTVTDKRPLTLGSANGTNGHEFDTFGFPSLNAEGGIRGDGHVLGKTYINKIPVVQIDSKQVSPGFSGAPVLDRLTDRIIGMITRIAVPDEYGRLSDVAFIIPSESLRDVLPTLKIEDACPYRGLSSFTSDPNDVKVFCGRDRLTSDLVFQLRKNPNFLAVVGPSGSGKSSVVNAGLLPAVRAGKLGFRADRVFAFPLSKVSEDEVLAALNEVTATPTRGQGTGRTVFLLDELEQFFVVSSKARESVIPVLAKLIDCPGFTLVTAFRSDFYDSVFNSSLGPSLDNGQVNVRLMSRDELKSAIATPAASVGLKFSEALVDDIAADAAELHNPLPLLEFTLTQLWEQRSDGELTRDAYRQMNGVAGSIASWATDAFARLSESERMTAQRILMRLIHYGNGSTPDTGKRTPLADLVSASQDQVQVLSVVMKLATARILTTDRDPSTQRQIVGLIHDALITRWEQLARWIKMHREFLLWRQRLATRMDEWDNSGKDAGGLLRGAALAEAEQWLTTRSQDLTDAEQGFVGESIAFREREAEATEQRRRAEIAKAQELKQLAEARAAERARQVKRLHWFSLGLMLLLLLALAAGAFALWQKKRADGSANVALARFLANQADLLRKSSDPSMRQSVLLGVEAVRRYPSGDTIRALRDAASALPSAMSAYRHQGAITAMTFSPDSSILATGAADNTAVLWRATQGKEISRLRLQNVPTSLTFCSDYLAISTLDASKSQKHDWDRHSQVNVWHHSNGLLDQNVGALEFASPVETVACSADNFAIVAADRHVIQRLRFGPPAKSQRTPYPEHLGVVAALLSSGAKYLAVGNLLGTLLLDAYSLKQLASFPAQGNKFDVLLPQYAFSENGSWFASLGSQSGLVQLWHLPDLRPMLRESQQGFLSQFIAVAGNGAVAHMDSNGLAIIGGPDIAARVVSPAPERIDLDEHKNLQFTPDSRYLILSKGDRTIHIYGSNFDELMRLAVDRPLRAISISPDSKAFAVGLEDGQVLSYWLRPAASVGPSYLNGAFSIQYSHTGTYVAKEVIVKQILQRVGTTVLPISKMGVHIVNCRTGRDVATYDNLEGFPEYEFSPDDRYLALSIPHGVLLRDLSSGTETRKTGEGLNVGDFGFSGTSLFGTTEEGKMFEWRKVPSGDIVYRFNVIDNKVPRFSPKGTFFATAAHEKPLHVWQMATGKEVFSSASIAHDRGVIVFSLDERYVAAPKDHNSVSVWYSNSGVEAARFPVPEEVNNLEFTSTGDLVGTGGRFSYVWDVAQKRELERLYHEGGNSWYLAVSGDSQYIAVTTTSHSLGIYHLRHAEPVSWINEPFNISGIWFTPSDRYLIVKGESEGGISEIHAETWRPQDLIDIACASVGRNLTPVEWQRYLGDQGYRPTCPQISAPARTPHKSFTLP